MINVMSEELKPCPFCGGEAEWNKGKTGDGEDWNYITCSACEAIAPYKSCQKEGMILDWNTRPIEDALQAENARLRDALKEIKKALLKIKSESREKEIKIFADAWIWECDNKLNKLALR